MQHSEKCRERIAESLAATEPGADRIARPELRINRGIEAASRLDERRGGGKVVPTVADQAEVPHTNVAAGPHPRDAGVTASRSYAGAHRASMDVYNARRAREPVQDEEATPGMGPAAHPSTQRGANDRRAEKPQGPRGPIGVRAFTNPAGEFASPDGDMAFIGSIVQDEDRMGMMMNLGTASKSHKREGRTARRRMVAEIHSPPGVTRATSPMPNRRLVPN